MPVIDDDVLEKQGLKQAILPAVYTFRQRQEDIFLKVDREAFTKRIRDIKESSINNIASLQEKAIKRLTENGFKVINAKDAKEAGKAILNIIGDDKAIIKAKSNAANEIGLTKILKGRGVIETDLGDFLCQLMNEKEIHPVLPAIHLKAMDMAGALSKLTGKKVMPEPEAVLAAAREYIRQKIVNSNVGITGATVITGEGSVLILENEGNISLVSRIPKKHIIISGFEKIVATNAEAVEIARASAIFGTAQDFPIYVNIISGPSKTADIENLMLTGAQGAKEVYLILIDNGRSEILKSGFKDLLYCINCGACLNFCPVFHQVTDRYGAEYMGSRGVIFSRFSQGLKESFEHGVYFCTLCGACKENCPCGIDLPGQMRQLRQELVKHGIEPNQTTEMIENVRKFGNPFGKVEEGKTPLGLYCC